MMAPRGLVWFDKANPKFRTILITGCRPEMDTTVVRVVAKGADRACYKPFDVPQLLETLEQVTKAPG